MNSQHKKISTTLNYIEHFLILASAITGFISISTFASLLGIPIGITSSAKVLKICTTAAAIKKCKSIIKKRNKNYDKIVLLTKSKLNSIEVLISQALIDSNIRHDETDLINNVLKEYDDMRAEIKDLNSLSSRFIKQCY